MTRATATTVALLIFAGPNVFAASSGAPSAKAKTKASSAATEKTTDQQLETYQDLIAKAQNLTLQQDRLQTSQVLIRGLNREAEKGDKAKAGAAYKELARALDELTSVFYTEKAQSLFATGESLEDTKPRDAIEQFQEALKSEDRNVSILKALARAHLRLDECDRAEARTKQAEELNPISSEVKLLRLQVLACNKNFEALALKLNPKDSTELEGMDKFTKSLQMQVMLHELSRLKDAKKDLKKPRALLSAWESQSPDYPEVYYWKWMLSKVAGTPDRVAAAKYSQLCQNLTPRKRKSFSLEVDLCKGKETVEAFLRETGTQREDVRQ